MAQTFKGSEIQIFETAILGVKATDQELIVLYRTMAEDVERRIKQINARKAPVTAARLNQVLADINKELTILKAETRKIITTGVVRTFDNTYYGTAYNYEKYVNELVTGLKDDRWDLGYFKIDRSYPIASLNERIAGEGLVDRLGRQSAILQSELRQAIGTAITVGDSPQQTAKNIERGSQLLQDVANKTLNHSATIARTETLKAYSLAQEIATAQAEAAGVHVFPSWDASLDGKTRPAHSSADGKKFVLDDSAQYVLSVGGVVFISPRLPKSGQTGTAGQVVNCRCRKRNNPEGFEPTTRIAKKADGSWETVNGDLTYNQWKNTLPGRAEINRTLIDRNARAGELRILRTLRNEDRKPTTAERKRLAELRKIIKRKE